MGRHSAINTGIPNQNTPMASGRTPASTSFGNRKREIERLDQENNRLFADNRRLFADNMSLTDELERVRGDLERINAIDILGREGKIRELEGEIARNRERLESDKQSKALEIEKMVRDLEERTQREQREREQAVSLHEKQVNELTQQIDELKTQRLREESDLIDLRAVRALNDVSMYDYENQAEDSVKLKAQLDDNKQKQKDMIREKKAVLATKNTMGGAFFKGMSDMALSLFNAEAENAVMNLRATNLDACVAKLHRCADRIERFGKEINLRIAKAYLQLRIKELSITAMYLQAVKAEKEAEKERRAELREQAKAQKELEVEMARLRKEQEHYQNVLAKMREQGDAEEIAKLEEKLSQIDKAVNDVDYRAANIRAGYVYVISDIGAFGERMVKIGMTRRLDPMDRVRELSDASVPFKFDVHALFFSKDAVSLETMLHHEFEDRRVNKVNARKEFYYCTPQEVLDKLREKEVAVVEYHVEPEAEEYRISQRMAEQQS